MGENLSFDSLFHTKNKTMKRIITLILAVVTLSTMAQDNRNEREKANDKKDLRSNAHNLKRDVVEIDAFKGARAEYEAKLGAGDVDGLKHAHKKMLKMMATEVEQARTRLGDAKGEVGESTREVRSEKKEVREDRQERKPAQHANDKKDLKDDKADLRDDVRDLEGQRAQLGRMNELFTEMRMIKISDKPQKATEGKALELADEFIRLMRNDITSTKKEMQEDKEELREDRKETREDRREK